MDNNWWRKLLEKWLEKLIIFSQNIELLIDNFYKGVDNFFIDLHNRVLKFLIEHGVIETYWWIRSKFLTFIRSVQLLPFYQYINFYWIAVNYFLCKNLLDVINLRVNWFIKFISNERVLIYAYIDDLFFTIKYYLKSLRTKKVIFIYIVGYYYHYSVNNLNYFFSKTKEHFLIFVINILHVIDIIYFREKWLNIFITMCLPRIVYIIRNFYWNNK